MAPNPSGEYRVAGYAGQRPLRKIKYYDKEYHRPYEFIADNMEMAAREIADIYKRRWQVELFFVSIQSRRNFRTFLVL
jgi:IS4 transposase